MVTRNRCEVWARARSRTRRSTWSQGSSQLAAITVKRQEQLQMKEQTLVNHFISFVFDISSFILRL